MSKDSKKISYINRSTIQFVFITLWRAVLQIIIRSSVYLDYKPLTSQSFFFKQGWTICFLLLILATQSVVIQSTNHFSLSPFGFFSDTRELELWIEKINYVAALLSSPPLPSAIGSKSKKFQKPLLPSSHTKLSIREQLADHETRLMRLNQELEDHMLKHPERGLSKRILNQFAEKQSYLEYEVSRR